ncbi:23S rRNA (cytidine(2498)-2'-O)-methyltransferase RlmM [Alteromonas sediminis]|uniref:23S rRNA (Cytidine(2498)-2'-O)-methyltransferase RlmM n=1 Tax=Alteromonas sediminis TaxID=2259342 RepID=A0A3N5Y368_9ALTE|nr:23S rRNA (cytidine(2498)-2'-O)-methyltransferase RlmM [Alteromonas sediminis]RPJ67186.1 23S rRNA (cytidine(2498)-2'-O)-methyltransferase RlmM [Alteromonas sediminis]
MTQLLLLCRSGYEQDLSEELIHGFALLNIAGYPNFKKGQAWLSFTLVNQPAQALEQKPVKALLGSLVFARQVWQVLGEVSYEDTQDRVTPLLQAFENIEPNVSLGHDVLVEHADSEQGNELARFVKKFNVPLRQAMRAKGIIGRRLKSEKTVKQAHVLFTRSHHCIYGVSINPVSAPNPGGIIRLKFPPNAPSRSTLKLEDAIKHQLTEPERQAIFTEGANGVDLGACPGGWTYQLVQRGMHVEAVDNGLIQEALMNTGMVAHYAHDGFSYQPQYGKVTLLVCDMIEQPDKVASLMAKWLKLGWTDHAIFNLKLPMKQRFDCVSRCLDLVRTELGKSFFRYRMSARHLYHDRDEVTVVVVQSDLI